MSEQHLTQNEICRFIGAIVLGPLLTLGIPQNEIRLAMKKVVETEEVWQALPIVLNETKTIGEDAVTELRRQTQTQEASRKPS